MSATAPVQIRLTDEQRAELVTEAQRRVGRGNRVLVSFGSIEHPSAEWCVYQRPSDVPGFHWVLRTNAQMATVHAQNIDWLKLTLAQS